MLHTKFQAYYPFGSWEEDFSRIFSRSVVAVIRSIRLWCRKSPEGRESDLTFRWLENSFCLPLNEYLFRAGKDKTARDGE